MSDRKAGCYAFSITFLALPLTAILNGLAISYMWSRFFMEKFGLPPLGVAEAILVSIFISFLTVSVSQEHAKSPEQLIQYTIAAITRPLIALAFFYVVMLFI